MNTRWLVAVLTWKRAGLSPAARYVLARFTQLNDVCGWTLLRVKEFAQTIGITDIQLGRGLDELVDEGVLIRRGIAKGLGRPPTEYRLAPDMAEQLEVGEVESEWATCIDHLLRHEGHPGLQFVGRRRKSSAAEEGDPPAPKRLSFVTRLLFAVLLCHADRFGIVQGAGRSTLGQQTGLSKERLRSRTQKLLSEGVLRAFTPGATGKHLFRRTASCYFLNLNHPDLLAEKTPLLLSFLYRQPFDGRSSDIVDYILKPADGGMEQRDLGIRSYLRSRHEHDLADTLRGKLDGYAAALLSGHWDDFRLGKLALQKVLQEELLIPEETPERDPTTDQEALAEYLIEGSRSIAVAIKHNCRRALKSLDLKSMDVALLPERRAKYPDSSLIFYSVRVLLLLPKSGREDLTAPGLGGCVLAWQGDRWTETSYPDPAGLSVDQQYLYGLRMPLGGVLQLDFPQATEEYQKLHRDD